MGGLQGRVPGRKKTSGALGNVEDQGCGSLTDHHE